MQSQVPCERRDKFFELERTGRLQERRKIWGPFEEDAHVSTSVSPLLCDDPSCSICFSDRRSNRFRLRDAQEIPAETMERRRLRIIGSVPRSK